MIETKRVYHVAVFEGERFLKKFSTGKKELSHIVDSEAESFVANLRKERPDRNYRVEKDYKDRTAKK
mgnify:CR=1 FL=1